MKTPSRYYAIKMVEPDLPQPPPPGLPNPIPNLRLPPPSPPVPPQSLGPTPPQKL